MANKIAEILNRFSTHELAQAIGAYDSQVSKWKNSRCLPSPRWFPMIAKITKVPVSKISEAVAEDKMAKSIARISRISRAGL